MDEMVSPWGPALRETCGVGFGWGFTWRFVGGSGRVHPHMIMLRDNSAQRGYCWSPARLHERQPRLETVNGKQPSQGTPSPSVPQRALALPVCCAEGLAQPDQGKGGLGWAGRCGWLCGISSTSGDIPGPECHAAPWENSTSANRQRRPCCHCTEHPLGGVIQSRILGG